jgi:hypothetical protein
MVLRRSILYSKLDEIIQYNSDFQQLSLGTTENKKILPIAHREAVAACLHRNNFQYNIYLELEALHDMKRP